MSDEPRPRKILSLKNPPARPLGPEPLRPKAPPAPPPPPQYDWKCKPCGAGLNVPDELAGEETVRCPNCNARLGTAADFRADPPPAKLRARPAKRA